MRAALAFCVLLVACSPAARLRHLIAKHPELVRTDTITVHDTITIPADTVHAVRWLTARDTITIENERQVVRVIRIPTGSPCDTAKLLLDVQGTLKADTVYREIRVPVEKVVPCPPGQVPWWTWAVIIALAVLLLYALLKRR